MNRLLYWLSGFLPCRLISDGDVPYLERYHVCRVFGWTIHLHRFVGSDPARGKHDHPFNAAFSIVLSGYYYEETRTGIEIVRWFNWISGDKFHRIVLPEKECWTLFCHGPHVKQWGFLKPVDIAHADSVLMWVPYTYADRESVATHWWKTAPSGKDAKRMPVWD